MKLKINAISASFILMFLFSCGNGTGEYADLIIEGKIFTAETDSSYASAVAVKNGKIIALDENALSERGENTTVIETEGLVLPGFVDCHSHGAAGLRLAQLAKAHGDSLCNGKNPFEKYETTDAAMRELIFSYQKLLAANGITSYCDACTNLKGFDIVKLYETLDKEGKIYIHTYGMYKVSPDRLSEIDSVSSMSTAFKGGNFELNTLKVYLDRQPYLSEEEENFTEDDIIPSRRLSRIINSANTGGLSVCAHAFGADAMKNFAEYVSIKSTENSRNSLVHLMSVDENCMDAIYGSRVSAIVNPFFFAKDSTVSGENHDRLYPVRDLIDKQVHVAIGIDFPSSQSLRFIDAIYYLAARKHPGMPDSTVLSASQRTSVATALRCATAEGAYVLGKENRCGTITIGKDADMVILDKDITNCPTDEIPKAEVLYTFIAGKTLFHRSDSVRQGTEPLL